MLQGFKTFILRGNVVDLAIGVVIGAAFSNVVNAFVKDILTPFIGALVHVPDFSSLTFTLRGSKFMYGDFLNTLISFVLMAAAVYFFVVLPINKMTALLRREKETIDPTTKKCSECLGEIPRDAKRCAYCTQIINNAT